MTKPIGIIAAMEKEISHLRSLMKTTKTRKTHISDFYSGELFDKNVVLVRSGIGKVNAAACTQALIDLYNTDFIINIGVGGGLDNKLKIGDIIIAEDLVQYDFDLTIFGHKQGVIPDLKESYFKCDQKILDLIKKSPDKLNMTSKIYFGRIISGDKFISDSIEKKVLAEKFNALCTEMEGAAIAQVCYINSIRFMVVRTISDNANNDALSDYENFSDLVAKNNCDLVKNILDLV